MHTILDERDKLEITDRIGSISNNLFRVTKTGKSIIAEDSQRYIPKGLRVFGGSEQKTTGGHQLIPYPFTDTTKTISGVTFTDEGNGWIRVSGTSTAKSAFILVMDGVLNVNSSDEVTIHSEIVGSVDKLFITGWTSTWEKFLEDRALSLKAGTSITGKIASNIVKLQVSIEDVDTNFDGKIRVMINKGTTALPWEPYTGGIPAPNPEYPQPIESVSDDGSVEIGMYGGNLATSVYSKEDARPYEKSLFVHSDLKPSTIYTISFVGTKGHYFYINEEVFSEYQRLECTGDRQFITAKTLDILDKTSLGYDNTYGWVLFKNMGTNTVVPKFTDVQIELGGKATEYKPYNKQSLAITTPNGLPGIKVTDASIATYTDENGQMWCADYMDFERGVYVNRIVKLELTGNEEWVVTGTKEYRTISFDGVLPLTDSDGIICTHYRGVTTNDRFADGTIIRGISGHQIFVCDHRFNDVDEFKEFLKNEKTNGNPVTVTCRRKTPIETPLSAEELAQYKALTMNYPTTTILNNANAQMEVEYVANTQNHIEQNYLSKSEFETLKTRISSIEKSIL